MHPPRLPLACRWCCWASQHGRPGGGAAGVAEPVPGGCAGAVIAALDAGLSPVQKLLVSTLPSIAPNLRVGNGLNANYLSHDAQVVADYQADPRCHRISARLALHCHRRPRHRGRCAHLGRAHLADVGGGDRLVSPAGSQAFARAAPAVVQSHCFENAFHELFNENAGYATPVFDTLRDWLPGAVCRAVLTQAFCS